MSNEDYERGYKDGENSARFDMEFALTEYGDYSHYRAVIELLAQEAESAYFSYHGYDDSYTFSPSMRQSVIDWLRSHLDTPE